MTSTRVTLTRGAALAVLAAHASPTLSSIGPLRRHCWPQLSGVGRAAHVALTFDDGPDQASTPRFLKVLSEHDVHATFFLLGEMLRAAPALGRDIADGGHELAVHGWRHRNLLTRGPRATYDDLARAQELISKATGTQPVFYRPPYGVLSAAGYYAARRLGMTPVLWTAWGRDWEKRATPASVVRTVLRTLDDAGTVLLHDSDCTSARGSWRNTLAALPELLEVCETRGWAVGPLRDHFTEI
jgi:peptidoglycan/xylan/chitin deacetylase (PgdA/CDA1 family)